MLRILETEQESDEDRSYGSLWLSLVLGFLGSSVILWIGLRALGPTLAAWWNVPWILDHWIRTAIAAVLAVVVAAILSRIEGTIWARYYVIIGYLLSVGLIVWIVLHLLHWV